ncbi:MAG: LysR family transcriptional regulator [Hyphomicrobiales bacterium]|nr:MAG: LysR family transcriptional regulator [Hyphomicrobiales bacterium]
MRRTLPPTTSLACFEAVLRHGSVTRASEELNMTQSAVSRRIASLEEQLDSKLFIRERKRLIPLPAAKRYGQEIARILADIEASTTRFISQNEQIGLLTIAVPPTLGSRWLIPRLNTFISGHPGVDLNLVSKIRPFDFDQENIDAAIHAGSPTWQGAHLEFLMDEYVIPVCAPKLLGDKPVTSIADMSRYPLIQHTTRPNLWHEWCVHFGVEPARSKAGPRFEYYSHVIQAAVTGIGMAVVPDFLVRDELELGKLVSPVDARMKCAHAYYYAYPHRMHGNPNVMAFGSWIAKECQSRPAV